MRNREREDAGVVVVVGVEAGTGEKRNANGTSRHLASQAVLVLWVQVRT